MTTPDTKDKLKWYVDQYVALGLRVLPVWGIKSENGKYICTCPKGEHCDQKPGKHPLTVGQFKSGVHSASTDREALYAAIEQHPDMNIAIAVPDGMIVIDVDPRNGGDYQLQDIESKHGKFPDTWDQITGGGGRHLCYQVPHGMKFAGKLAPGIDIKQGGGYIMVEPSLHESGQEYGWEASSSPLDGISIEMAPHWLIAMSERPTISSVSKAMATFSVDEVTVADLRSALLHIDPDDRDTWVRVGHALKTIGDAGLDIWDQWSQRSPKYKAGEIVYRWNGFAPGNITYKTVFHMAQECGWTNAAKTRPKAPPPMPIGQAMEDEFEEAERIPLFEHVGSGLDVIKEVEWTIERYVEQDAVSMVYGPSGVGKSFVVLGMACAVATGTPWFGMMVKQGPVFYIAGEGHNGLMRRFKAWETGEGVSLRNAPLYKSRKAIGLLNESEALLLREELQQMMDQFGRPSLIVVDTLARNFGDGDENSTEDMSKFIRVLDELRAEAKCHVMVVHHSGHEGTRARGSSSLRAAMDQEYQVTSTGPGVVLVKNTKMKDAEPPAERHFRIKQIQIGQDVEGIPINGAYLTSDGDPLDFVVGKNQQGQDIKARQVVSIVKDKWVGYEVLSIRLSCSQATARRIVDRCVNDYKIMAKDGRGFAVVPSVLEDPLTFVINKAIEMEEGDE